MCVRVQGDGDVADPACLGRASIAAQLDYTLCLVGFAHMLNKKIQPDSGEQVLECRRVMHTRVLAMSMPTCMHTHDTNILMTRADTLFLSKEVFMQ